MHGQLTEWTQDVADVLAKPPGRPQLQALTDWLQRLTFTDHFALFIYEGRHPPLALFNTFPPDLRQLFVSDYQAGPYLLDPFYLACVFDQADGLYSMRRLAPERFRDTEYFRTYYRDLALSEKLGFIISLGEESRAVLSLMRLRGTVASSEEERQLLRGAAPVVEQVVRSAWAVHRQDGHCAADDLSHKVGEVFEQFGRDVLTARECEVARLLLEGHSNISVSQRLRISPGTVKVHRRSLYEKLSIGSQSQLLALFVRKLKEF
ncbi:LuxR family transcriptional regulator [Pseudomonas sp. BN417]|uniref:helix-turn-helix transcriptional regulator n=1 Tax=Pseudomonas sp. BN417 TaxID=2567890 RepID=UPI002455FF74|nr:LuxR C-terminal-related transcriptional regulator [Pseudomonas sp. BN417]MDH4558365.1 LuxR family transcriptional regulator [Pseudomonas sp. BN417]